MILDTNALSALAEGNLAVKGHVDRARLVALPVIVLGEYRFGVAQSRHRHDYERWLEEMVSVCRVLGVDEGTAGHYAEIRLELKRAGTPIPSNDAWIAALCRQHSIPILSRDQHFNSVRGLERLHW